ncbi:MAG: hypothetical protein L0H53_14355, partial [Candidatus Nitrosocosmicus sp.]|nr:hypothetical protein [Candidatus Nitrosocosmicus sp.]MDN5866176.1 hypothetical protein [Candidatus Nitrosocosmicus sp.]
NADKNNPRANITSLKYQKSVSDRRKKVNDLLMKGYTQQEIMSRLHLSQSTASRDIAFLYNQTERNAINIGKVAFEELHKSMTGTTELLKRGWELLEQTTTDRKLQLKVMEFITNCYQRRTELIQAGPILLYLSIQTKRFTTIERFLEKNNISIDEYTLKAIIDTAQKEKEMTNKRKEQAVFQ